MRSSLDGWSAYHLSRGTQAWRRYVVPLFPFESFHFVFQLALTVILDHSFLPATGLAFPKAFQTSLHDYLNSSSSQKLTAALDEAFAELNELTKEDGQKLLTIVLANRFCKSTLFPLPTKSCLTFLQ